MKSLIENDTYTLTKKPEQKKVLGGKWVFGIKYNGNK